VVDRKRNHNPKKAVAGPTPREEEGWSCCLQKAKSLGRSIRGGEGGGLAPPSSETFFLQVGRGETAECSVHIS